MKQYQMICQVRKPGEKAWTTTYTNDDPQHVLQMLADDLAAKYIGHASRVKSIKRRQTYLGTCEYTVVHHVTDSQECRTIYTAPVYCM